MTTPIRAALYLRVSTGRQADNDLSIPDQRRQGKGYCTSRGWEIAAEYIEPGASATDDRRPEFQRMIDAATAKPPMSDAIVVHSFSRFFRDQFQLEFYVRRLAKSGVRSASGATRCARAARQARRGQPGSTFRPRSVRSRQCACLQANVAPTICGAES
jgi:DNA invertase Pin-like site-specific DNA recombinase